MKKTEIKEIGKHRYHLTQMGVRVGTRTWIHVARLLGPTLGTLAGSLIGAKQSIKVTDLDWKALIVSFVDSAKPEDLEAIVSALEAHTTVSIQAETSTGGITYLPPQAMTAQNIGGADEHFAGRYSDFLQWLIASLSLNYSDFLAELGISLASRNPTT